MTFSNPVSVPRGEIPFSGIKNNTSLLFKIAKEQSGLFVIVTILIALLLLTSPAAAFSGSGAGSAGDPYQINTPGRFLEIQDSLSSYYKVMNDLDFNGVTFNGIAIFTGSLDGQNYTVKNIVNPQVYGPVDGTQGTGLFDVASGATIKNLHIDNLQLTSSNTDANQAAGGVIGLDRGTASVVSNVIVTNSQIGVNLAGNNQQTGGIIGQERNSNANIQNCLVYTTSLHATSQVYAVGGILGYAGVGVAHIENCFSGATKYGTGFTYAGGIVGSSPSGNAVSSDYYNAEFFGSYTTGAENAISTSQMQDSGTYTNWAFPFHMVNTDYWNTYLYPVPTQFAPVYVPVGAFSFNPANVIAGAATVTITGQSTNYPTYDQIWWGDGTTDYYTLPATMTHTFSTPTNSTTYTMTMRAGNSAGNATNVTHDIVFYRPPFASWSDDQTDITSFTRRLTLGQSVTITDTSTNMPTTFNFTWGTTPSTYATASPATKTYATVASFTPSLTVTNPAGSSTKAGTGYKLYQTYGVPTFSTPTQVPAGTNFNVGDYITFGGTASVAAKAYNWNFYGARANVSALSSGNVQFNVAGSFPQFDLQYQNYGNNASYYTMYSTGVHNFSGAFTPTYTANVTSGYQPLSVLFTDTTTDATPLSTAWNFGDGTGTGTTAVHTYANPGSYSVTMTHTQTGGNSGIASGTITVTATQAPTANFNLNVTSGNVPVTVQFTDTSTLSPLSWSWAFGDGDTSTLQNPTHTYLNAGSYTVTLTVTTGGGSSSLSKGFTALIPRPVASFTPNPITGAAPVTIQFTDTSTGNATSWAWNFGDGTTSVSQNPSHIFYAGGYYVVTMYASNAGGQSLNTYSYTLQITPIPGVPSNPNGTTINGSFGGWLNVTAAPSIAVLPDIPVDVPANTTVAMGALDHIAVNTTGVTTVGGYKVDSWILVWYIPLKDGSGYYVQDNYPRAIPANAVTTFGFNATTSHIAPTDVNSNPWSGKYLFKLFAVNNTAPDAGFGQGKVEAASTTQDFQYVPPSLYWSWADQSVNPAPGSTLTVNYAPNSYSAFLNQDDFVLIFRKSTDGGVNWIDIPSISPMTITGGNVMNLIQTFSVTPSEAEILQVRMVAYHYLFLDQVSTGWESVTVQDATTPAVFNWKDASGNTITNAMDTDKINFGFDTGTAQQNQGYSHLVLLFQKYNTATKTWTDLPAAKSAFIESVINSHSQTAVTTNTHAWGSYEMAGSASGGNFYANSLTADSVGLYRAEILGQTSVGYNIVLTSATLTVNGNPLNPVNAANGVGGFMGLGSATGGNAPIFLGLILMGVIAIIGFFVARFNVYGLLGGAMIGFIIDFAMGLFPEWMLFALVVIGICVVVLVLFMGRGKEGGDTGGGQAPIG